MPRVCGHTVKALAVPFWRTLLTVAAGYSYLVDCTTFSELFTTLLRLKASPTRQFHLLVHSVSYTGFVLVWVFFRSRLKVLPTPCTAVALLDGSRSFFYFGCSFPFILAPYTFPPPQVVVSSHLHAPLTTTLTLYKYLQRRIFLPYSHLDQAYLGLYRPDYYSSGVDLSYFSLWLPFDP